MDYLAWKECRELLVLRNYRDNLGSNGGLRENTRKGYGSVASSWVYTMALRSGVTEIAREEETYCVDLARKQDWKGLHERRDHLVTARLLTLSHKETCDHLLEWTSRKNISVTCTGVNGVDRFYRWLESESLIERNHFHDIRGQLELRVFRFRASLQRCQER